MSNKRDQWVVKTSQGWGLRKEGSTRLTKEGKTQQSIIKIGTGIAKNQKVELFIQGRDGKIRERNSFGKDSHPPKG